MVTRMAFKGLQILAYDEKAGLGTSEYPPIDYNEIIYFAAPKKKEELESLDEVDPELLETFNKLGISLEEQKSWPV